MSFKMKLAMAGYRAVSREIFNKGLFDVGLWPLCNKFGDKLRDNVQRRLEGESISAGNKNQKVRRSERLRCAERAICSELQIVLAKKPDATVAVTAVENILQIYRTSNRVLWESAPLRASVCVIKNRDVTKGQRLAMWLTRTKVAVNAKAKQLCSGKENEDPNVVTAKRTPEISLRLGVKSSMPSLFQSPSDDIVSIRALLRRLSTKARRDKHDHIRGKGAQEVRVSNRLRLLR